MATGVSRFVISGGAPTETSGYRRRAVISAIVCGVTLLGLLVAVFSLIDAARKVTSESAELHVIDGSLRQLDLVKAQIAEVVLVGGFEGESSSASITRAREGLDALTLLVGAEDIGEVAPVVAAGAAVVDLAEQKQFLTAQEVVDAELLPALDQAQKLLKDVQTERLASVLSANQALRRFGAVGGFLVAFVVPTVGVFIFREITRRPKALAEVEAAYVLDREERHRRALFIGSEVRAVRADLESDSFDPDRLRRLDDLLQAQEGEKWTRPRKVNIDDLIDDVAAELGHPVGLKISGNAGEAWCDQVATADAMRSLLGSSFDRGARSVEIVLEQDDGAQIWISDDGQPLDREQVRERVALELADILIATSGGNLSWGDGGRWAKLTLPEVSLVAAEA